MNIAVYTEKENILLCKFECDLKNIVGGIFFTSNSVDAFYHKKFEYDEKIFIIPYFERCTWHIMHRNPPIPPSLYMIDVENGQILYCGYFKEWYEELFDNGEADNFYGYYFKITKKISEGNDNEEI